MTRRRTQCVIIIATKGQDSEENSRTDIPLQPVSSAHSGRTVCVWEVQGGFCMWDKLNRLSAPGFKAWPLQLTKEIEFVTKKMHFPLNPPDQPSQTHKLSLWRLNGQKRGRIGCSGELWKPWSYYPPPWKMCLQAPGAFNLSLLCALIHGDDGGALVWVLLFCRCWAGHWKKKRKRGTGARCRPVSAGNPSVQRKVK